MTVNSGDKNNWREKYLNALDEQEQLEKQFADQQEMLRSALVRVSVAADGQDETLDQIMVKLREQLRSKMNPIDFNRTLAQLESAFKHRQLQCIIGAIGFSGHLAIRQLGRLARDHADLPMAARTYGQAATPTSFGAVVASWGHPILRHRARLAAVRDDLAVVSLGGAAGTLSAMGTEGPATRAALAAALGLTDPGHSWHAERDSIGAFAAWMAGLVASLGKMGEDLILLVQSGQGEVVIAGAGGSSTMPQKQNPVGPSVLVALARHVTGLAATLQGAALHRQQRDGAAWFAEWLSLPQACILTSRALGLAQDLAGRITPNYVTMARNLTAGGGLIHAEALSFALATRMPRPEAQAVVKRLCREVEATGTALPDLAMRDFPGTDWHAVLTQGGLGQAPTEARAFAEAHAFEDTFQRRVAHLQHVAAA